MTAVTVSKASFEVTAWMQVFGNSTAECEYISQTGHASYELTRIVQPETLVTVGTHTTPFRDPPRFVESQRYKLQSHAFLAAHKSECCTRMHSNRCPQNVLLLQSQNPLECKGFLLQGFILGF